MLMSLIDRWIHSIQFTGYYYLYKIKGRLAVIRYSMVTSGILDFCYFRFDPRCLSGVLTLFFFFF